MQAGFVDHGVLDHFLADGAGQVLHDTADEVGTDHVVEGEGFGVAEVFDVLVGLVVYVRFV